MFSLWEKQNDYVKIGELKNKLKKDNVVDYTAVVVKEEKKFFKKMSTESKKREEKYIY